MSQWYGPRRIHHEAVQHKDSSKQPRVQRHIIEVRDIPQTFSRRGSTATNPQSLVSDKCNARLKT